MATVEELLIRLGVDPVSVTQFIDDVNDAKNRAEGEAGTLNLSLKTDAGKQLASVTTAVENFGLQGKSASQEFRRGLQQVGEAADELKTSLLAIGAIGALGLGAAIGKAAEESNNLAKANVLLKFTSDELATAQEALRKVADEAGLTFQEVSAALFDVASAGFRGEKAIQATRAAALAAVPGGNDVTLVFNAIATAMKNFGFEADEAADKLVATADITRGSVGDVSEALGILGPLAGQFGISFEEIGGSFAFLTEQGIPTARAITSLNAAINTIISPSKEAEIAFDKAGVAIGDTAFKSQTLVEAFDKITIAAGKGELAIGKVFSLESLKAAAALIGSTEALTKSIETLSDATGRTEEALDTFFQLTGPQLDKLGASFVNLITIVGEDFLEALDGTIRAVSQFITDNREFIAVVIEAGSALIGLLVAITAVNFVVRQLASFQKLLAGATLATKQAINLVTIASEADTAATAANTAAKQAGILPGIITFLRSVRAALLVEISTLTPNIALWIKRAAIIAAQTFVAALAAIRSFLVSLPRETVALIANTRAWIANRAAQLSFRGVIGGAVGGLKNVTGALFSTQGALGALAAGFIGFEVGTFLNDIFGISDAIADLTRESVKAAEVAKQNILSPIQREILEEDARVLADFNEILANNTGITRQAAFIQAASIQARIAALKKLQAENNISAAQVAKLASLEVEFAAALKESNAEIDRLAQLSRDAATARKFLEDTEKQFQKVLRDTEKALITVRRGQEAAQVVAARQAAEERFEFLRKRGAAEIAQVREIEEKITAARREDPDTVLTGLTAQLEAQRAKLDATLQVIGDNFEVFTARITETGEKRISELRQQAASEVSIARKLADEVIKEEQRKAKEAIREIEKLRDARDRGISDAESFIERLTDAAIRKVDPALAQLRRFEQEAVRGLSGATAAQAERAIGLIRKRIEELASATREEIRAQEELDAVNRKISTADPERDVSRDIERRQTIQQQLIRLQELREKRAKAAVLVEQKISEAAAKAAKTQEEAQKNIEAQQARLLAANDAVLKKKEELILKEQEIGRELAKNIKKQREFLKANIDVLKLAVKFSQATAQLVGADTAANALLKEIQAELDAATQKVKQLERVTVKSREVSTDVVGVLKDKGDEALSSLTETLKAQQEAQKTLTDALPPIAALSDELTRVTETAALAQGQFATTVDEVLAKQIGAGQASTKFASTVNVKLGEIGNEFQKQSNRVSRLEREADQKRIAAQVETEAGGL